MAKKGLVRVPYYPQLSILGSIHRDAPLVMSLLLFWMARSTEPTFCEVRHNYQMAMHLGLPLADFTACLEALKQQHLFIAHEFTIAPKEVTADSKERHEIRLSLDFAALEQLLARCNTEHTVQPLHPLTAPAPDASDSSTSSASSTDTSLAPAKVAPPLPPCVLNRKLLQHAADDSFDFYDVIDSKFLPVTQQLHGSLGGDDFTQAALLCSQLVVYLNDKYEDLAFKAIAPGWKLLLTVPLGQSWQDYAQELSIRFLRSGERAIDLNLTDGNFFFPDSNEIKSQQHLIKHYGKKTEPRTVASALLLTLCAHFPERLTFYSELSVKELSPALHFVHELWPQLDLSAAFTTDYFHARRLTPAQKEQEKAQLAQELTKLQSYS